MFSWLALLSLDYWIFKISLGMVQKPIPSYIQRCTPRLVSRIEYDFGQWSVVSFVIKKIVYLFMVKECIYLVIQMYFMQIYIFTFYDLGINLQIFLCFRIFCWRWYKEIQNYEKIQNSVWKQTIKSAYEQQSFVL